MVFHNSELLDLADINKLVDEFLGVLGVPPQHQFESISKHETEINDLVQSNEAESKDLLKGKRTNC
jgi:hypothetical protein